MAPLTVFASGTVEDNQDGINMTNSDRLLVWVAKRGKIHDWTIYTHWAEYGKRYAETNGDTIMSTNFIKKLVPCDETAFNMYRY